MKTTVKNYRGEIIAKFVDFYNIRDVLYCFSSIFENDSFTITLNEIIDDKFTCRPIDDQLMFSSYKVDFEKGVFVIQFKVFNEENGLVEREIEIDDMKITVENEMETYYNFSGPDLSYATMRINNKYNDVCVVGIPRIEDSVFCLSKRDTRKLVRDLKFIKDSLEEFKRECKK